MDRIAESNRAFRDLEDTLPHIVRGLEIGLLEAWEHFDHKSLSFDSAAFFMLVRLHARAYLTKKKLEAGDLDAPDFEMQNVNLCGLWIHVGRYHLRVWKIPAREMDKALARQASGEQLPLVDREGIPIVSSLGIFWTPDDMYRLDRVYLVQPSFYDKNCLEWVWKREIPLTVAAAEAVDAGDVPFEEKTVDEIKEINSTK